MDNGQLKRARKAIQQAAHIVVLTGAGVSAESGIPTFRSDGGFWQGRRAEDLATPEGFHRDPKGVWEWYDWRRSQISETQPNAGHLALAEFERQRGPGAVTLVTQNVDGLHERAGSRVVLRLHGSIWEVRCLECGRSSEDLRLGELPPKCADCGGMLRPGVVWFGEDLPEGVFQFASIAVKNADVLVVVGTSAVVFPAALLIPLAASHGATVIEINPEETEMSLAATFALRGPSGTVLPALLSP
ncbi:MAG: NAD-dependent deacylase [Bryobacteraceae bacterium]|nr:NAD-dependent deacylase [Bryobacteraceae bacterium]